MRSLMLPPGFWRSSFIHTSTRSPKRRLMRTCGVLPIVSRMLLMHGGLLSDHEVDRIGDLGRRPDADLALVVDERVGGTEWVSQTLPPITLSGPMTVSPPSTVALA